VTDALRHRVWLVGFALMLATFGLQASALRFGDLTVVQPILTVELLFLIVILKVAFHRTIGWREAGGSVAIVAGLTGFIVSAAPRLGKGLPSSTSLAVVSGVVALAAVGLVVGARWGPRWWRAAAFGAGAGALFAYNASLTKATTTLITGGWGHVFTHWEPYGVGLSGTAGFFLLQNALHAGPIAASRAALLMVNPTVSVIVGVAVFGEHLRGGVGFISAEVASLAVMLAGAYVLTQSPLVAGTGPEGERLRLTVPA
jgi:hypothetical protein